LAEHKLSISGIVDQKTVQKLGQIAGVDAIVTGSITPLENSVRVVCKVIATDTARVIGAAKGDIAKTKAIEELLGKGIEVGASIVSPSQAKPKTVAKEEAQKFIFNLKGCQLSGQNVNCDLLITNKDENDRELDIYSSRMFDDRGNEYKAHEGQLGVKKGKPSWLENILVSGIPTKASVTFEKVSKMASAISLFEITFTIRARVGGRKYFSVQFRNIPLSR
jgi:hypothetical protein